MAMIRRTRGFTLIELMIVVAIIAILAAIAVPWWGRYTFRARRADGQKLLMHIAQAQERYYTDYNHYTSDLTLLGYKTSPAIAENNDYSVTVAAAGTAPQVYVATAVPINAQVGDKCGSLTIDNTGNKQPDPTKTAQNSNGSCW
jgi:type IV pilus assembly protein PilE